MATGNAPRGFPRILQWLLAGLMLIIGLAVVFLGQNWPSSAVHCTSR
ncbi:glucose dehydrogenase [Klebsiella pneumoniae]|uniref:Glucose dehydrogenase n=1 Tax=Klebsiella pneumoniae TaxID=573 RepID=A0A2X3F0K6_KLEPN|nr:glucose dehydrogenase [Klebsiella pneumoniae]